ncbi:MAG TPA: histidine kinase [Longimicrobiaceae bacterium]|nr:histidine kinase [Longimicrobiaceae bacterium]
MSPSGGTQHEATRPARHFLRGRRAVLLAIVASWTLVGLFYGTRPFVRALSTGRPADFRGFVANFADAWVWALLTVPILWLAGRFRFEPGRRVHAFVVHLAASLVFALVSVAANVALSNALWPENPSSFGAYVAATVHWNVQWYWIVVGIRYAWEYYRKYRDRELRATQLEAQLARAQLEALKMQVQPHFLFNTLHTISELVHESPEAADQMIVRLGDLLRLTVDNAGTQEVTLRRELEFLHAYLEIEQARFRDRLSVQVEVDPETLDARVPNLLLQPLVENALRHGIGERAGPGRVSVRAARQDGRLWLEVRDDGGGLPAGGALRERVGVGNTRERLRQLYGAEQSFELLGAPEGGVVATITLPLRFDGPGEEPEVGTSDPEPLPPRAQPRYRGGAHADPVAGRR